MIAAVILAAYTGGIVGAVLVGANHPVPAVRTVTVQGDGWTPLPLTGGGRAVEQK